MKIRVKSFKVNIDNSRINSIVKNCSRAAVHSALDHVADVSKQQVPVDTGALKNSCTVSVSGDGSKGSVSYDTSYAVEQHENQMINHQRGRKAKYLEDPCYDSGVQSAMFQLVASAFTSNMK